MSANYEGDSDLEFDAEIDMVALIRRLVANPTALAMLDEALAVPQLKRARRLGNSGSTRSGLFGPYGGGHS